MLQANLKKYTQTTFWGRIYEKFNILLDYKM